MSRTINYPVIDPQVVVVLVLAFVCVCGFFVFLLFCFFARSWLNLIELGKPEQAFVHLFTHSFSTCRVLEVTHLLILPLVDVG